MLWHLSKSRYKNEITVLLSCVFLIALYNLLGIPCLFYKITSIPCPTCYMTRALLSLAKGDISAYISYNIMALPVAIVFILELFHKLWGKYENIVHGFSIIILIANFTYYLWRII